MPTFDNPAVDAAEAQQALRGLAHATRAINDPQQIYSVLGSLSQAVASLEQSLHQLATYHDGPMRRRASISGDPKDRRAAAHRISWELHHAGEILRQVATALDRAHEVEAEIAYGQRNFPEVSELPCTTGDRSLEL